MKLFLDTNILIDAFTERDLIYKPSQQLLRNIASGKVKGFVSAKQITDFYYCLRKYIPIEQQRREIIRVVLKLLTVFPTLSSDLSYCLNSPINDYEDALINEVCKVNCVNYLVTNDTSGFRNGDVVVFTPQDINTLIDAGEE